MEVEGPREAPCVWTSTGISLTVGAWSIAAEDLCRTRSGQTATVTVRWRQELCYLEHLNLDRARPRQQFLANFVRICRPALRGLARRITEAILIRLADACRGRCDTPSPAMGARPVPRTLAATLDEPVRTLLTDPQLLFRVGHAMMEKGWAGDWWLPQLAYVALTSRLLERPMNLAFVAAPATGKNATIDAALALIPSEAVYVFTAASPTALIYSAEDLRHRVVFFKEADSIPDHGAAASAIRSLAEGNALQYAVTMLNRRTGQFETRTVTKEGPTGLLTTSTRPLRPQLNARLLPVPVPSDVGLTRTVLLTKARRAAGDMTLPDREPFLGLQRWLEHTGKHRVIVPFATKLAELVGDRTLTDVRLRRDFDQLLSCVKTLAVLHQQQRASAPGGEIIATMTDYDLARSLLASSFEAAAAEGPTAAIRDTVLAIGPRETDVRETELARRLELTKQAISWRVTRAVTAGWLANDEQRSGKPYRLRRGEPLPRQASPLPEWREVEPPVPEIPDARMTARFYGFATTLVEDWPTGVTVAEWVGGRVVDWTKRPVDVAALRARFEALRKAGLLDHDAKTDRYVIPAAVWQRLKDTAKQVPAQSARGIVGRRGQGTPASNRQTRPTRPSNEASATQGASDTAETPTRPTVQLVPR